MGLRDEKIASLANEAIEKRVFPGCAIGVIRGFDRSIQAFGRHTYETDSPPVAPDTIYDCASITKSIPLALLAQHLISEGELGLEDRLIKFVPAFDGGYRSDISIENLLTYTIGGIGMSQFKDMSAAEILEIALHFEPSHPPGTYFEYANLPAFLLGLVIEKILGPLESAADRYVFTPLGMRASTFFPKDAAPTEIDYRGTVQNVVHDESAYVFRKSGRTVGHAGLFSNVHDLLIPLLAFMEGRLDSKGAMTNMIPRLGNFTGLGWELNQPHFMGAHRSTHTFGKTGFTGTSVVCDVPRKIAVVILSNRTYPRRPADGSAINAFRSSVCDIVFTS